MPEYKFQHYVPRTYRGLHNEFDLGYVSGSNTNSWLLNSSEGNVYFDKIITSIREFCTMLGVSIDIAIDNVNSLMLHGFKVDEELDEFMIKKGFTIREENVAGFYRDR